MIFKKWVNLPLKPHQAKPVRVVGDGAIQTVNVAEGRLLPVLIIDAQQRPDIVEHVRLHQHSGSGDVKTTWCKLQDTDVGLLLQFSAPSETTLVISFDVLKQHSVIDLIIQSRGLYLQCGKPGDRLKDTINDPKVVVEVAESGFDKTWEKILLGAVRENLKALGSDGRTAKRLAPEHVATMRKIGSRRLASSSD
jgi:hypothetical protein